MKTRWALSLILLGGAFVGLLASDGGSVGAAAQNPASAFTEIKWPFLMDQWGTGRAFQCAPSDCGVAVNVYVRPKIGFCNCSTGVSDDMELERVGDLSLLSDQYVGLHPSVAVKVGWMGGRSRVYEVTPAYGPKLQAWAVAFNNKCDVVVATVTSDRPLSPQAEQAALDFLNSDVVLAWAKAELGV